MATLAAVTSGSVTPIPTVMDNSLSPTARPADRLTHPAAHCDVTGVNCDVIGVNSDVLDWPARRGSVSETWQRGGGGFGGGPLAGWAGPRD